MRIWEVAGEPVSFCWYTPVSPRLRVTRISALYTPPSLRGHGYASANVAAGVPAGGRRPGVAVQLTGSRRLATLGSSPRIVASRSRSRSATVMPTASGA